MKLSHEKHTLNAKILLLTCDASHNWRKDPHAVTVDRFGKIDIEFKIPWETGGRAIDTFYRKSDFEETRKSKTAETFIILQEREHLIDTSKKPRNLSKRYKYIPMEHGEKMSDGRGSSWYYRIKLKTLDENGATFEYDFDTHARYNGYKTNNIFDIIDKSGYLLIDRRNELKHKAEQLRADRKKTEYTATDHTPKAEQLKAEYLKLKQFLIEKLTQATTSEETAKILSCLDFRFRWILSDIEQYTQKTQNKTFSSIEASENTYKSILHDINKLYEKAQGEKEQ